MMTIYKKQDGLSAMQMVMQQLGSIIYFASSKSSISKNFKKALLRLQKSMSDAKQDREKLLESAATTCESKGYNVYPDGDLRFRR